LLDLSAVSFVTPFGILVLHGLIKKLTVLGCVELRVPNTDVATYLWRMNFHKLLEVERKNGTLRLSPDFAEYQFGRRPLKQVLLEPQEINVASDEQVAEAEAKLWWLIRERAPRFETVEDQVRIALVEIISNVQRHSGTSKAWVVAQTYVEPSERLEIAIADAGMGLRASLERLHQEKLQRMSDWEGLSTSSAGMGVTPYTSRADVVSTTS
jgi:anti-sigma regulatory factor (Ser/Thr protein kinase)